MALLWQVCPCPPFADSPYCVRGNTVFTSQIRRPFIAVTDAVNICLRKLRVSIAFARRRNSGPQLRIVGVLAVLLMVYPFQIANVIISAVTVLMINAVQAWRAFAKECAGHQPVDPVQLNAIMVAQNNLQISVTRNQFAALSQSCATSSRNTFYSPVIRDFVRAFIANDLFPEFCVHAYSLPRREG